MLVAAPSFDPGSLPGAVDPSSRPEVLRRLYDLMQRVNASVDLSEVLDEIARGVVEVLGFGVAAISRLEGETLVMTNVVAPPRVRDELVGRRTPVASIINEFDVADEWGVLRFVPHDRLPAPLEEAAWVPDVAVSGVPGAWHPLDTLYAPLWSATGVLLGNLAVDLPADGMVPGPAQRELLEMFVVQAGLALDNAVQRERLAAQVRMGEVLQAVSSAARLSDLERTLEGAGVALEEGFGKGRVWIRCFPADELGDETTPHVYPAGTESSQELVAAAAQLARRAAISRHPVLLGRAELAEAFGPMSPRTVEYYDPRSAQAQVQMLLAPVSSGREVMGYLVLARDADEPVWSELEQHTLMEVGTALGRVVLDGRLLERERHLVGELRELDRYKGELIATISHELRTPLSSIIGHTELLGDLVGVDTEIGSVAAIARNARRLDRLVKNLLDYSALQQARVHERRAVDLRTLGAGSIDLVAVQAERGGLTLALEAAPDPVWVDGDAEELGTVVDNLVGNAVKYTRSGGRVTVTVGEDADGVFLDCADTGLGISEEDQAHLFSVFQRSTDPEALSQPGSGLGLAISRRIVRLHGGDVTVTSELGRGSLFTVRLPHPVDRPA